MTTVLFTAGILVLVGAIKPQIYTRAGYKLRYVRNRFYRDVLERCPHCKEKLSKTGEGRGVCTTLDCGKR